MPATAIREVGSLNKSVFIFVFWRAPFVWQVSLLKECDHPNVIRQCDNSRKVCIFAKSSTFRRLHEVLSLDRALYLVFEYVDMARAPGQQCRQRGKF